MLLNALTGSVGAVGGTSPNAWNKFIPAPWKKPTANAQWNELNWPREYPLAHNEMSPLYPHLLLDGRGTQPVLFTRVLNPIWTYPDGYSWLRALRDESLVGLHGALTPTWSETAWWSDYVLPMGHGPERHDTHSYETHSGRWLGFRQPVQRVAMERLGPRGRVHPRGQPRRGVGGGRVLDRGLLARGPRRVARHPPVLRVALPPRREDPAGGVLPLDVRELGPRPAREGRRRRASSRWPTCASTAAWRSRATTTPSTRPRSRSPTTRRSPGAEETITAASFNPNHLPLTGRPDTTGTVVDGVPRRGFNSPSRKLELYSETLEEWGWPDMATPHHRRSHVHPSLIDHEHGEYVLLPTYRLPTMIHSRSGNAKFLNELAHTHPLLVCPEDAARIGVVRPATSRASRPRSASSSSRPS